VLNKVTLIGRLGMDPETKTLPGFKVVTNFTVATSERWQDKEGNKSEKTEWHKIVVWGKLAEICGKRLSKGSLVYIDGKLQTRSWDDQSGQKKYATEIVATSVTFLGPKGKQNAEPEDNEFEPMFDSTEEIPF